MGKSRAERCCAGAISAGFDSSTSPRSSVSWQRRMALSPEPVKMENAQPGRPGVQNPNPLLKGIRSMTRTELPLPDPPGKVKPVKRLIRNTGHLSESPIGISLSFDTRDVPNYLAEAVILITCAGLVAWHPILRPMGQRYLELARQLAETLTL